MWSIVVSVPCGLEKKVCSALIGGSSTDVGETPLAGGGVECISVLLCLLSILCLLYLSITDQGVDVSSYDSGCVFFLCYYIHFASHSLAELCGWVRTC